MSDTGGPPADDGGTSSLLTRDVLLVALAVLALVVAAFAVPPLASAGGGESGGDGRADDGDGKTTTPTPDRDESDDRDQRREPGQQPGGATGDGDPVRVTGANDTERSEDGALVSATGTEPHSDCFVVVWDRLVPGRDATVLRWYDGAFVEDRRVWFDGELVGRTDGAGRVDGRVPYARQLPLTAAVGDVDRCHLLTLEMETGYDEWRRANGSARIVVDETDDLAALYPRNGNVSTTLEVRGSARVGIEGEPYPGDVVRANATVDGVPVRDATVAVDGRQVGRTDGGGTYDLRVPDDGTEELTVAVSRGDFGARATVDVLRLSLGIRPVDPLAIPGGEATVFATVGDRPAEDVTVAIDGERAGTTGPDGRAAIDLPVDPRATVSASAQGQTATTAVWPLYVPGALLALLVLGAVAVSVAWTSRRDSPGARRTVAVAWVGLVVLATAGVVAGRPGILAVLGAGTVVGLLLGTLVYRDAVGRWLASAVGLVRATVRGLLGLALGLADWLGWLVDGALRAASTLLAKLIATPRSLRAVVGFPLDRVARLPERAVAAARRIGRSLRPAVRGLGQWLTTPRGLVAVGLTAGLLALGDHVEGEAGALAAAVGVLVVALAVRWRRSTDHAGTGTEGSGGTSAPAVSGGGGWTESAASRASIRTLWRTFARWVVPGRVRSRTPGEVGRAAIDRGFPREPVHRLTAAFREVEYGDRELSEERLGRARAALDALRAARTERDGGER